MQNQFSIEPPLSFPLWTLVYSPPNAISDSDVHHTFYIRINGEAGILTFASPLDAEIYCQRLSATGKNGWRRERLERIDIDRMMSHLPQTERKLMLALGFFASDTNDLLLDADKTLITPLLPVPFSIHHYLHEISHLEITAEIPIFVQKWWERIGGPDYREQVYALGDFPDHVLRECAAEALDKAPIMSLSQYNDSWKDTGVGDECAVFVPETGVWKFSTLQKPRTRLLH